MHREAALQLDLTPSDTRFVVQGYGNVGSWAARIMQQLGARMVGASAASGAIRADDGIDAEALAEHVFARAVTSWSSMATGRERISPDELLETECEVFIPAAPLGGMIHEGNADRLRCKDDRGRQQPHHARRQRNPRRQGHHGGARRDGQRRRRGRVLLRWVQNLQHFRWDEREVNDRLGRIMRKAFREVSAQARADDVSMRVAAFAVGIERVVDAATTRGYVS